MRGGRYERDVVSRGALSSSAEAGSGRRLILLTSPGELSLPSARRTPARRATDRTGECFWITTLLIKFPVLRARSELRGRQ